MALIWKWLTKLSCIRLDGLLVFVCIFDVGSIGIDRLGVALAKRGAVLRELRVIWHVLAPIGSHTACILAPALVGPLEQGEVVWSKEMVDNSDGRWRVERNSRFEEASLKFGEHGRILSVLNVHKTTGGWMIEEVADAEVFARGCRSGIAHEPKGT